jgi:hypothetical protein
MAQAIGVKAAYEKAQAAKRQAAEPGADHRGIREFEFRGAGRQGRHGAGQGPSGVQGTAYGVTKNVGGKVTVVNIKRFAASRVTPSTASRATSGSSRDSR